LRIHLTYYSLRINFYRKQFTLTYNPPKKIRSEGF
jgi:hypothetical protein